MSQALMIRPVERTDFNAWERMRTALWPEAAADHGPEIAKYFSADRTNPAEVLIACAGSGAPVGFVELSIRAYAEGCFSDRIAFVEGWFVEAGYRNRGAGTALMAAAEEWARAAGCTELASDTETHNETSIAAHKALGFEEVERIVCFRKAL